jgi:hypothetical protein
MKRHLAMISICCSIPLCYATNAAPFGQELGVAKCQDSIRDLSSRVNFESAGVNKYTKGPMYSGKAEGLGLEGAKSILLICDKNNTLSAIQLVIDKGAFSSAFDKYIKMLKSKYKQVYLINPSVGTKASKYSQGGSSILLFAPHMSFDMSLIYATNQFMKSFDKVTKQEDLNKEKFQQNSL